MANSTAVKSGGKKEGLVECLTGLEDAAQKVFRLSKDVKDAEGIADEARRLRSEIREKDAVIAEREMAKQVLVDHFELKAVKSHQEKIALQKSLEVARADQGTFRKLDAALKEASAAKEEARSKEAELLEASAQATGFKIELGRTRTELDDLHKCIGLAEPGSTLSVVKV